jgi:glutamyl-tRNA reductase
MELTVIGVDHNTAPVAVREAVALNSAQALSMLNALREEGLCEEAVVLSTCNRTDIYCVLRRGHADVRHVLSHLAGARGGSASPDASMFRSYRGEDAVRRLFRTAAGLESQVVGEHEILGQVKEAYRLAVEARTARFLLHKLLHAAFRAGKRVQTHTRLGEGTASVSQAAVDLAAQIFSRFSGKTVMLFGAGQTGELAAEALIRAGADNLIVANRTLENAKVLARELMRRRRDEVEWPAGDAGPSACPALGPRKTSCSLQTASPPKESAELTILAVSLSEIPSLLPNVDLLISSTGSSEPVLRSAELAPVLHRRNSPLLLIDIAVPRDIEPELGNLPNVFLYNIDDLEGMVARNLAMRKAEIPRAEEIVADELRQFMKWMGSLSAVPTIKSLRQFAESLVQEQLEKRLKKLPPDQQKLLLEFSRALCNKLLHNPTAFLNSLSDGEAGSDELAAIDILRKAFCLDEPPQNPEEEASSEEVGK